MNIAIILAAGKSQRAGQNKLWAQANSSGLLRNNMATGHNNLGRPLWTLSYQTFLQHPEIGRVILVVPKGDEFRFLEQTEEKTTVVAGGETRMDSFKCGLAALGPASSLTSNDIILDHNAANPNVTAREISEVISAAREVGAAAVSHTAVDTIIESDGENYATPLNRGNLRLMQTPQAVRGDILCNLSNADLTKATDLMSVLLFSAQHCGSLPSQTVTSFTAKVIEASPANRKITYAEDIDALRAQTINDGGLCDVGEHPNSIYFLGEDSHRFSDAGALRLGGFEIPELPALEADSDGDVMLHAIGRALAQVPLEGGGYGSSFSEVADPLMLSGGQDSRDYLEPFLLRLEEQKLEVSHISISLECSRPKIDPIKSALKETIAKILSVSPDQISIEAMSGEGLTSFGRGQGIRCTALVTIIKRV